MRSLATPLILGLCLLGCGDDSGDGDTDGDGAAQGSSSTGGGNTSDNGCGADGYTAATAIAFGGEVGTAYEPRCVSVSVGGTVTWTGDFGIHPLVGGAIEGMTKVPDASSPIGGATAGSPELAVTFDQAGTYPFYCDPHGPFGMNGAVRVE